MSMHTKWSEGEKRLIIECGTFRVEIICKITYIEFCPICGEKIDLSRCQNAK